MTVITTATIFGLCLTGLHSGFAPKKSFHCLLGFHNSQQLSVWWHHALMSYIVVMDHLPRLPCYCFTAVTLICVSGDLSISDNVYTDIVCFNLLHHVMIICAY